MYDGFGVESVLGNPSAVQGRRHSLKSARSRSPESSLGFTSNLSDMQIHDMRV